MRLVSIALAVVVIVPLTPCTATPVHKSLAATLSVPVTVLATTPVQRSDAERDSVPLVGEPLRP